MQCLCNPQNFQPVHLSQLHPDNSSKYVVPTVVEAGTEGTKCKCAKKFPHGFNDACRQAKVWLAKREKNFEEMTEAERLH